MKRDPDLIRQLLLAVEQQEEPFETKDITLPDYDSDQVMYHAEILSEAGFLVGEDVSTMGIPNVLIRRMTFEGHEFLDAIRSPSVWRKTRDLVTRAGGGFAMDVVKKVAISILLGDVLGGPRHDGFAQPFHAP